MKIYGYVRVSTLEQNKERQRSNIKKEYPNAIIIEDEFTGKTMDRPNWSKLYPKLKKGDVIVFDEVSRMSRNAQEGFETYQELFERGCELVFLKEPHINTSVYRSKLNNQLDKIKLDSGRKSIDKAVNGIVEVLSNLLMDLAQEQIQLAFEQSQAETDLRAWRAGEGIQKAKENNEKLIVQYGSKDEAKKSPEWREIGRSEGDKLHIKKAEPIKKLIREFSRDFDGTLTDGELLGVLSTKTVKIPNKKRSGKVEEREISAKISRNTLYKYKKEMRERV